MIQEFIAERRPRWERLESLLKRGRGHRLRLPAAEIEELGRLYRQATSDLAVARRDFPSDRLTRYLEQLVGRAHPAVYRGEPADWTSVARFFGRDLPATFRASGHYTLAAFGLFVLPFLLAYTAAYLSPTTARLIVGSPVFVEQVERGQSWLEIGRATRPLVASFVMTNNIQVAFLAVAGGVLFGIGTVYVLIGNGLSIGATAGLASASGLGGALGDFVTAHGGVELSVIFIAGGAGLRLGHALLVPGLASRRQALTEAAQESARLLFGCVPLLVIAGLIEGFVSPSALPTWAKVGIGLGTTALMYGYLLLAGADWRGQPQSRGASVGR
ncbi:MAG: stage II sporulation protein M [Chloroflexi bacterium]|nr:stage II sporulation protein M [Chloroflexota bacterium]